MLNPGVMAGVMFSQTQAFDHGYNSICSTPVVFHVPALGTRLQQVASRTVRSIQTRKALYARPWPEMP